jgi:DNA topoisomerase-1
VVSLGRYGPYVTCGDRRASLPDWRAAADVGLAEALAALDAKATGRASRTPISELGEVEGVEGKLVVMSGRYGPYVTNGVVNATLPKDMDPASLTAEQAAELVKAKIAAGPSKRPARRGAVRRGRRSP